MKKNSIETSLTTQSLVIKSIWSYALPSTARLWSSVLEKMPRNIYTFSIRYLGNCLPNRSNTHRWGAAVSGLCSFCPNRQTLGHVIGGCKISLEEKRFNWRHNSILLSLARATKALPFVTVYCDIEECQEFLSPSIISGDSFRPDMIVVREKEIFVMELTVGFEPNMQKNALRKQQRYKPLIDSLSKTQSVHFLNLSVGAAGIISNDAANIFNWMKNLGFSQKESEYLIRKTINICIRTTYYLFCRRDKPWETPKLLSW